MMRRARTLFRAIACGFCAGCLAWYSVPARAQSYEDTPLYGEPDEEFFEEGKKPPVVAPGTEVMPDWPDDSDLVKLEGAAVDSPFELYIDVPHIKVGKDKVVRYVVLMRSESGVTNAVYEGLDCDAKLYKTYGYGMDGQFRPRKKPPWKMALEAGGTAAYHTDLYRNYLCGPFGQPLSIDQMRRRFAGVNTGEDSGTDHGSSGFFGW